MFCLVAIGANSMKIPTIFFNSRQEVTDFLEENDVPNPGADYFRTTEGGDKKAPIDFYKVVDETVDEEIPFISLLVNGYYGGCGEIFAFEVKEVITGKPMFGWDLD